MASEAYKKKIIALWKIRKEIAASGDHWASAEYAGKGTKGGFIQSQYFFNIERQPDRDLTDKQKQTIDKLVGQYITGDSQVPPAHEDDPIPDEEADPNSQILDWGNGVTAKPNEEGAWVIYINDIQAGATLTLKHARIIGDWLHMSIEFMMLAIQYAVKFQNKIQKKETSDPADDFDPENLPASNNDEAF